MMISLIGLPGVGKSTIGKKLAAYFNFPLFEMDHMFVEQYQVSICDFFSRWGEAAFREKESEILHSIVHHTVHTKGVISTGGGIIIRPENRTLLQKKTVPVYIRIHPNNLIRRVASQDDRPLFKNKDYRETLHHLYNMRKAFYEQTAHITVESDGASEAEIVEKTIQALDGHKK